ncbi:nitrite reductase small subunit NirD [Thalassospira mesophila]|uniref:Nitrite reductase n=1 Tax=Thalassospira mesophila TaxID=1293891 RepID=A0A1Y2KV50_9PROT|nr:nitrite reductase small subunit NirD [Thalassospira mesophila]OSQ35575.1 nitrite reductase [Thalassospira mesophila]
MADILNWVDIGPLDGIPVQGARTLQTASDRIAVFRTLDNQVFALLDRCPHKQGPLSQGIVHGHFVTCPLHNMVFSLETGLAQGADDGCAAKMETRLENGMVRVGLTPSQMAKPDAQ